MKESYIQISGIVLAALYGIFIIFLYAAAPRSLSEVPTKAIETVQNAASKGSVIAGTYEVDQAKLNEGLNAFRSDNFVAARDLFEKADPEHRDARIQFYIAYSFYRQGWGRISNDDVMFKQGLAVLDRVDALDRNFRSDDPDLKLRTPAELRNEFQEGMRITPDDFNPLKVLMERK